MKSRYLNRPRGAPRPSVDDLLETELVEAAVQEGVKMIKPWVQANPARLLKSLTHAEMTSMAQAMVGAWIAARSKAEDAMPSDPIDDLWR